ncbi:hypothetical protein JCM8097_006939 [Rhodosporidiobolus ruineniae]
MRSSRYYFHELAHPDASDVQLSRARDDFKQAGRKAEEGGRRTVNVLKSQEGRREFAHEAEEGARKGWSVFDEERQDKPLFEFHHGQRSHNHPFFHQSSAQHIEAHSLSHRHSSSSRRRAEQGWGDYGGHGSSHAGAHFERELAAGAFGAAAGAAVMGAWEGHRREERTRKEEGREERAGEEEEGEGEGRYGAYSGGGIRQERMYETY